VYSNETKNVEKWNDLINYVQWEVNICRSCCLSCCALTCSLTLSLANHRT